MSIIDVLFIIVLVLAIFLIIFSIYDSYRETCNRNKFYDECRRSLNRLVDKKEDSESEHQVFSSVVVKSELTANTKKNVTEIDGALTDLIVTTNKNTHLLLRIEGADGRGRTLIDAAMTAYQSRIVRLGSDSRIEPANIVATSSNDTGIKIQIVEINTCSK